MLPRADTHLAPPAPADDFYVARGDSLLDEGDEGSLRSEIPGVDDARWTQFVRCMIVAPLDAVSPANTLGLFELTPRRLADLGLVTRLARKQSAGGRPVWVAVFVPPLTCDRFLRSPSVQYKAFADSMGDYSHAMRTGQIEKTPEMSESGALAILHRAGPRGLETWAAGERFPATVKCYERVAGIW